jgi:hypothetical protein
MVRLKEMQYGPTRTSYFLPRVMGGISKSTYLKLTKKVQTSRQQQAAQII